MRKINFVNGEHYHIFNRGVDKRVIFPETADLARFFKSMVEFNSIEPIGSIFENSFRNNKLGNSVSKSDKLELVNFICYCLNPNHYHFILEQIADNGIRKFMHRLGLGYTKYLNGKYKRNGFLFQGPFKAIHINSNEYLLHLSAYVNLNNRVHNFESSIFDSSWDEYLLGRNGICKKNIITNQFKNISEYKNFAENSLKLIREKKEIEKLLLE
ncbi:transposase [Patescibacteria group bacterium]|nr:transposase [Patescibacteria group bacterium]MBU4580443.1 transposase [Patescibacteria group bacterium]